MDSGKLVSEYHYLGGGLSKDADPSTVVILCDSFPDGVILGLADGSSHQIFGQTASGLKRQFDQGVRPLIWRGDGQPH